MLSVNQVVIFYHKRLHSIALRTRATQSTYSECGVGTHVIGTESVLL